MANRAGKIEKMPLLALRGLVVFPHMLIHFDVGRKKFVKALERALSRGQSVFLVAQRDAREEDPSIDGLYKTGTVARIRQVLKLPNDTVRVLVEGGHRAVVNTAVGGKPFESVEVIVRDEKKPRISAARAEALLRYTLELFEDYVEMAPRTAPEVLVNAREITDVGHMADYVAQMLPLRVEERQELIEEINPVRRLERVGAILMRELEVLQIEHQIQMKLRGQLGKNQRDYYLREQLKTIQEELGEESDSFSEADEYRARVLALKMDETSKFKLLREVARMSKTHANSPEMGVIRTYLDTVLELPWNTLTADKLDLARARRVLDRDHYGLDKVKERVLEFLAVKRLAPELKGQILCLVGPPGVGKTSVASSIARAMGRKLGRLSLGGVRDEADIRGHRKTYVGAMPGRLLSGVRQAGSRNPILLLDEVDKMGHDFRGDPAAALLEVLDAEQNHAFRDHYLEIPFDLSEVLFITTANTTDTIPRALLDRMEVIQLTSYTDQEKLQIAKRHLLPKQLKKHGLTNKTLKITDGAILDVTAFYTRESGVRKLEQQLAAICRKAAFAVASDEVGSVSVKSGDLESYLGPRRYKGERRAAGGTAGVANGLAWTQTGGEILQVEAGVVDGSGKMELTGNLGEVMKESAKAALTYIRSRAGTLGVDAEFYKTKDIHIHFPDGAVPKDGPSAGITVAAAMVSALTGAPLRPDTAMTGEITLRGRVLPIGGLKEKTMAALRAGMKTVVIPAENEGDLAEIDQTVRGALRFVTVSGMDAALDAVIDRGNA